MMEFPADAELCIVLSEQPEKVFCVRGFLCLVGVSEYGKFHNQFCWIGMQRWYFFSECCQYITIICTFAPNYKPNYD